MTRIFCYAVDRDEALLAVCLLDLGVSRVAVPNDYCACDRRPLAVFLHRKCRRRCGYEHPTGLLVDPCINQPPAPDPGRSPFRWLLTTGSDRDGGAFKHLHAVIRSIATSSQKPLPAFHDPHPAQPG